MNKNIILSLVTVLLVSVNTRAQAQDILLKGRSGLELNIGIWTGKVSNSITAGGTRTEAKLGSFVGGILFAHWLQENLALTISAGLLAGEASSTVSSGQVDQHSSTVAPVLIGIRYYLPDPEPDVRVRPFLSAALGAYVGSEAKNTLFSQEAHTETSFGGRLGGGVDLILGDHFKLGVNMGYHIMSDFSLSVGTRKNYNGGEFSIGIGYIF